MPIKSCTLNGNAMRSLDDFYDRISTLKDMPEHFGRNLDALRDVLSTDVEGPFEIIWKNADASKKLMGKDRIGPIPVAITIVTAAIMSMLALAWLVLLATGQGS